MDGTSLFTSHSVIAETINHIVRKGENWLGGRDPFLEIGLFFRKCMDESFVKILYEAKEDLYEVLSIAQSRTSISGMNYTDYLSCIHMRKHKIKTIVTKDEHFKLVGMNFQLIP